MAKLVNWHSFERIITDKKMLLFSAIDIRRLFAISEVAARFILHRYNKKGLILRLRRGLYTLPNAFPPDMLIANKLYEPSYVSLEFALSYYGIIPEAVYEITSVTTKATRRFKAIEKIFSYRRIKKGSFTGYSLHKQRGFGFFIADAEKALVDTNYLRILKGSGPISRFDKAKLDPKKVAKYSALFGNRRLSAVMERITT